MKKMKVDEYSYYNKALMCPKCFSYVFGEISIHSKVEVESKSKFIKNFITEPRDYIHVDCINAICPNCKNEVMLVEVDAEIVRTISILNKKGYTTRWCCSGHEGGSSTPYIAFEHELPKEVIKSIPKRWYYERRHFTGAYPSIHVRTKIEGKLRYDCTELDRAEALYDIYDWAKELKEKK